MLKRDLMGFIERVKQKAVNSVIAKHDKIIKDKQEELLKPYSERMEMIQNEMNRQLSKMILLATEMKEDCELGYNGFVNRQGYIKELSINIKSQFYWGNEISLLREARKKEQQEVESEYNNLFSICKAMTKVSDIVSYLEELGFDLSDLKSKDNTKLVAKVDKSKLFVCGENK